MNYTLEVLSLFMREPHYHRARSRAFEHWAFAVSSERMEDVPDRMYYAMHRTADDLRMIFVREASRTPDGVYELFPRWDPEHKVPGKSLVETCTETDWMQIALVFVADLAHEWAEGETGDGEGASDA